MLFKDVWDSRTSLRMGSERDTQVEKAELVAREVDKP